jgi:hypothetical protein
MIGLDHQRDEIGLDHQRSEGVLATNSYLRRKKERKIS